MVYPHVYTIPIVLDEYVKAVSTQIPLGLLKLTIQSVEGLKSPEFITPDPFVQFSAHDTEFKTQVLKNTTIPVW